MQTAAQAHSPLSMQKIATFQFANAIHFALAMQQFVSKLEIRVLVELFLISRLQRVSSQSVRADLVCFEPVRNCITSGKGGGGWGGGLSYLKRKIAQYS